MGTEIMMKCTTVTMRFCGSNKDDQMMTDARMNNFVGQPPHMAIKSPLIHEEFVEPPYCLVTTNRVPDREVVK